MLSETEGDFLTLHEFVKAAKARLSPNIWDYLVGATETETTMLRNRMALDSVAFRPRVLRDVQQVPDIPARGAQGLWRWTPPVELMLDGLRKGASRG